MARKKVLIFDTTLRDGEQAPGASLNTSEKVQIAKQLERLGVDAIEAGFPVSSPGDLDAVRRVAKAVTKPVVCGLARATKKDIDACWEAVKYAKKPRIHVFIATSDIHMKYKLKKSRMQVLKEAIQAVRYARKIAPRAEIEFSAEDASRSQFGFLVEVVRAVIKAGADIVNIPDTVGYALPDEFSKMLTELRKQVSELSKKVVLSVHCHNDLGLAVANSLAAVRAGARQIECTVNGIGERAGNCSLEEVVMGLKTRQSEFGVTTGIKTPHLCRTSRLVSKLTGFVIQRNKAIVGRNAFAHEAGIHQHGVLASPLTYEIMHPEDVGWQATRIVLGKHSGRHALVARIKELGYEIPQRQLDKIFTRFKELADKKKQVYDEDITALVEEESLVVPEVYSFEYLNVTTGNKTIPTATVGLKKGKQEFQEASCGDGPVDAAFKAVDKITGIKCYLDDYSLHSISSGKDALGDVSVRVFRNNHSVTGHGSSTDIIEASVKAYINAINRLLAQEKVGTK